jgi:hypothetical protein
VTAQPTDGTYLVPVGVHLNSTYEQVALRSIYAYTTSGSFTFNAYVNSTAVLTGQTANTTPGTSPFRIALADRDIVRVAIATSSSGRNGVIQVEFERVVLPVF